MKVEEDQTRTEVRRLPSRLGDVILQRDTKGPSGQVVHRETTMFVPRIQTREDELCLQS